MSRNSYAEGRVAGKTGAVITSTSFDNGTKEGLDCNLLGGNVTIENATLDVTLSANTDSVTVFGGVNVNNFPSSQNVIVTSIPEVEIKNDSGSPVPISATSLPLPSNAATEATLLLIKAKTDNLDVALSTRTKPADSQIVVGPTVSGSSLTASPVTLGGLAKTANPTAVSDGQVVNSLHDKLGKQVVVGSLRDLKSSQQTTITSSTGETTIVTADATNFLDLYGLILTNTSATGTKVTIKDATSGTTRMVFWCPANDTRGFMLPESAAHKQASNNNNWTATCGTSVASMEITAMFVKNL